MSTVIRWLFVIATASASAPAFALTTNPVRAYPPSCLSDPLPTTSSGPLLVNQAVPLAAFDIGTGTIVTENVTVLVWRIACSTSDSSGGYNAATLIRFQRSSGLEGSVAQYPLFPDLRAAQNNSINNISFDSGLDYLRVAEEPNTFRSEKGIGTPLVHSETLVLENYLADTGQTAGYFVFNAAFQLRIDPLYLAQTNLTTVSVAAYLPNSNTYPAAFANLPISTAMSTTWYDPAHQGEGMTIQVFDNDTANLGLVFEWFTYDDLGLPYWLYGQQDVIPRGQTSVSVPTYFITNGGFGGTFGSSATANTWGTVNLSWPDCNTLVLTYQSNPGLPSGTPSGSDTLTWKHYGGLTCE